MEDEDSENGLVDTWTLWEEAYYKDSVIETSLAQINNSNICLNEVEENREDCFYSAYSCETDDNENSGTSFKNVIKGFKKNILKQVKENQTDLFDNNTSVQHLKQVTTKKENKIVKVKTEKMAEYTQYLGLQPTLSKSECNKCNSVGNNCSLESNLNCDCSSIITPLEENINNFELPLTNSCVLPSTSISKLAEITANKLQSTDNIDFPPNNNSEVSSNNEISSNSNSEQTCSSSEVPVTCSSQLSTSNCELSSIINSKVFSISQASNFKITRKVYLCAACETYFENWNLFLHMREVHKRHICLFCLGMFGQAERLSRHLSKKHNIPEVSFHSVEELYKTFKGSCYVVCCSCEKMFSETDNFYNHFCSTTPNEQSASELYSLYKQVGTHMQTCSLIPEKNKLNLDKQSVTKSNLHKIDSFTSSTTITGIRRHSKRTIKPNRINDDVYLYTKLTNIRPKRTKLQNVPETNETNKYITKEFQTDKYNKSNFDSREILENSVRDTVAETIMEVSKCREDSDSYQSNNHVQNVLWNNNNNKGIKETKSLNSCNIKNIYDSVTETIMEVSRCTNISNDRLCTDKAVSNKKNVVDILNCSVNKGIVESSDPKNEDDVRLNELIKKSVKTKDIGKEYNFFNDMHTDSNSDSGSQPSNGPSSPKNRSVFSPTFEIQEITTTNEKDSTKVELESKFISSTPVTDRSLVIKICTKNNSVFSISTPTTLKKNENHEYSRESEENNNGEVSNNKVLIIKENDGNNSKLYTNDQDNDSNSDKLSFVGTNEDINKLNDTTIMLNINKENKPDIFQNVINSQQDKKIEELINIQDTQKIDALTNNIENSDGILLAGEEIPIIDLNVDGLLETMEVEDLLKRCIKAVCAVCVYCNHARHIAVNAKQLSLHMLAEHRFQPQHPAIIIHQEQFTTKVKKCLEDLETYYFNLDSYNSKEGTYNISTVKVYECFLCRFYSSAHKELYLHNRKIHQKPILICIMCKSSFCSYSELLCHLCPGVYAANVNIQYRCCLCSLTNLPSAFRLMVHLRKQHHACDVCLESTGNQQRLSNHVWKHKLHHLCYRCGIAYRNKPDITKHLFWKHGTESVLCKKCLQKKWPHIYHFCIPPTAFSCEECGFSFSRAVALKVHKRTHTNDFPYSCSECPDKFISKKLLTKHEKNHKEPLSLSQIALLNVNNNHTVSEEVNIDVCNIDNHEENATELPFEIISKEIVKKVVDVYDLPPLNLSSDSDSEIESDTINENKLDEKTNKIEDESNIKTEMIFNSKIVDPNSDVIVEVERNEEEKKQEEQIMDGIWDNFKSYTASLEKQDSSSKIGIELDSIENQKQGETKCKENKNPKNFKNIVLADHDYCIIYSDKIEESCSKSSLKIDDNTKLNQNSDLKLKRTLSPNVTNQQNIENDFTKKIKTPKKKKQNVNTSSSDSSSDSDSSSCSCGTNCSCSSSSSSSSSTSSSSSDSDSTASTSLPLKINVNRDKHKKEINVVQREEKDKSIKENTEEILIKKENDRMNKIEQLNPINLVHFEVLESDLDTTETETDEDFYDEQPQQLVNKLLAEKRNKLMLLANITSISVDSSISTPINNGLIDTDTTIPSFTPSTSTHNLVKSPLKKKIKTRKYKRDLRGRSKNIKTIESIKLNIPKLMYQKKELISKPSTIKRYSISNLTGNQSMYEVNKLMTSDSLSAVELSQNIGGSGSENDVKRSSKRKRVPKRFYGDSSDEENHKQQMLKWRRVDTPSTSKISNYKQNYQQRQLLLHQQQQQLLRQQQLQLQQEKSLQQRQQDQQEEEKAEDEKTLVITPSSNDSNEPTDSSSESTDSDNEIESKSKTSKIMLETQIQYPQLYPTNLERANNLYCYCQCPYDEVSEMIACDGNDCQIEWFHFECVGIMVPPKGKWYCPDCRRKLGIPDDVEDFTNG